MVEIPAIGGQCRKGPDTQHFGIRPHTIGLDDRGVKPDHFAGRRHLLLQQEPKALQFSQCGDTFAIGKGQQLSTIGVLSADH